MYIHEKFPTGYIKIKSYGESNNVGVNSQGHVVGGVLRHNRRSIGDIEYDSSIKIKG